MKPNEWNGKKLEVYLGSIQNLKRIPIRSLILMIRVLTQQLLELGKEGEKRKR